SMASGILDEVRDTPHESVISKREEEVLQMIADGASTVEVAERLYISIKTVKNHLASTYQKLDARDRTQAVLRAGRMGIIQLRDARTDDAKWAERGIGRAAMGPIPQADRSPRWGGLPHRSTNKGQPPLGRPGLVHQPLQE